MAQLFVRYGASISQDDGMPMCMLKTHDGIMMVCRWNSQDDGGMSMCL
jgi:hypothetical protein